MTSRRYSLILLAATFLLVVMATYPNLVNRLHLGLKFRGEYEIYFNVLALDGKGDPDTENMPATAKFLRGKNDRLGPSDPEVRIEGKSHIRDKMAGPAPLDEVRENLVYGKKLEVIPTEKYTQTFGSVLGWSMLKETLAAGGSGIVPMALLLLFLYRGFGLAAAMSTLAYFWLLVVLFCHLHATIPLSAVVAFVLGIGMGADASIICFERVREVWAKGIFSEIVTAPEKFKMTPFYPPLLEADFQ